VSERETDERALGAPLPNCPACGAANRAGDRFCAACGSLLATAASDQEFTAPRSADAVPALPEATGTTLEFANAGTEPPTEREQDQERDAWIFGARPAAVIVGGVLLLALAAALLAIGQRDDTGTIVMLSLCTAPLGLLILAIGIARAIAGTTRRG
jgi:hypothetical protein